MVCSETMCAMLLLLRPRVIDVVTQYTLWSPSFVSRTAFNNTFSHAAEQHQGFEWYRAWIVKCHANDTFDVRFTRPSTPSEDFSPRGGALEKVEEWRFRVETPSLDSGSEEHRGSDGEVGRRQESGVSRTESSRTFYTSTILAPSQS